MRLINIIQVDTPLFEYKGVEYAVETRRYIDFCDFQKYVDIAIDRGYTHCFIYNVINQHDDKMIIDISGTVTDVWIRSKFVKIEDEQTD
ncbi:MAG: hypothetical protein COX80_04065 [Candidatus Magasanikbacteria bacterium CG_4_10_14_0_2_um_filter_33_14]|uniref:Uncharacterized protein n=1 Tax=Candidatus Magasanikbacteria bacterium CG_4_10_14_0_2_um_filter_33_14 TaxID=1974636 RepID=A0A2M7V9M9_9BACT|nr:MAG: hypothetical protein COX80_04065 [Candidatus Magasanikbacteria bacterium CG_4_10_14_0_2_um_filter_33_14]